MIYQASLNGSQLKVAIVVSRFNNFITERLLSGAKNCLLQHQTAEENIDIVWVPGAFELPIAAMNLAKSGKYQAVICLGVVIR